MVPPSRSDASRPLLGGRSQTAPTERLNNSMASPYLTEGSAAEPVRHMHGFYSPGRLKTYSDALFGIIATVMVVQIKLDRKKGESLMTELLSKYTQLLMYFVSYFLCMNQWVQHVRLYKHISYINDGIILLNTLALLLTASLPFVCSLTAAFPQDSVSVTLTCVTIMAIGAFQTATLLYVAFNKTLRERNPDIMHQHAYQGVRFSLIVQSAQLMSGPFGALIVMIMSISWPEGSFAGFYCVLMLASNAVLPEVAKRVSTYTQEGDRKLSTLLVPRSTALVNEHFSKARLSNLSDGVFSIAATLIVLNIEVPDPETTGNLRAALQAKWPQFISFFSTFLLTGFLWFVHQALTEVLVDCNLFTLFFNNCLLASVGLIPFVGAVLSHYQEQVAMSAGDEAVALRLACIVGFAAGLSLLLMWASMLMNEAQFVSHVGRERAVKRVMWLRLLVIPGMCAVVFGFTFLGYTVAMAVFGFCALAAPVLCYVMAWRANKTLPPLPAIEEPTDFVERRPSSRHNSAIGGGGSSGGRRANSLRAGRGSSLATDERPRTRSLISAEFDEEDERREAEEEEEEEGVSSQHEELPADPDKWAGSDEDAVLVSI